MSAEPFAAVRDCLQSCEDIHSAILFGSVAAGTARSESDLDIAVIGARALSAARRIELVEILALATGRPIDLVDLATAGEPLLGQILSGGERLFGSDEDFARLVTRHVIDAADFLPYRDRIIEERRRAWIGE